MDVTMKIGSSGYRMPHLVNLKVTYFQTHRYCTRCCILHNAKRRCGPAGLSWIARHVSKDIGYRIELPLIRFVARKKALFFKAYGRTRPRDLSRCAQRDRQRSLHPFEARGEINPVSPLCLANYVTVHYASQPEQRNTFRLR